MQPERIIQHIVDWLSRYCAGADMAGYVVGVSGGVDSAVTSTLCAATGNPVRVLSLPIHQDPGQLSLADRHCHWLAEQYPHVTPARIDLTALFDAFCEAMPDVADDALTLANTRSRLRMVTLYAQAGRYQMLVAGTGNKVEDFGVGFFTKYGDGAVDVSPLADLTKTEVYGLARHLNILSGILQAPPTDGLWSDNRSDESQLGATYAELEWAMAVEAGQTEESGITPRQREVLAIYRRLHRAARHKIDPVPVCRIPDEFR